MLLAIGSTHCGGRPGAPIGPGPGPGPIEPAADAIVGTWAWFNTPTVYIDAGGALRLPGTGPVGEWTLIDAPSRLYQLAWGNGFIDHLALSANGDDLAGYNQYGTLVTALRVQ
jgi:hypothetical protein